MNLTFKDYILLSVDENKEILKIRNSNYVNKNMNNSELITLKNHEEWLKKLQSDKSNIYYAIFNNKEIVGAIYITDINYDENTCTWGLYFKENINVFISSISTYLLIEKIFYELNIKRLNLEVKKNNLAAYKFDQSFGFKDYSQLEELYFMYMDEEIWKNKKDSFLVKTLKKKIDKINYKFIEG